MYYWFTNQRGILGKLFGLLVLWFGLSWNTALLLLVAVLIGPIGFCFMAFNYVLRRVRSFFRRKMNRAGFLGKGFYGTFWLGVSLVFICSFLVEWAINLGDVAAFLGDD